MEIKSKTKTFDDNSSININEFLTEEQIKQIKDKQNGNTKGFKFKYGD